MKDIVIRSEGISKQYRLGAIGTGALVSDLNRFWHLARGKDDPYLKIGEKNIRNKSAKSGYVWALKDIDFDIHQGESVAFIGKNGAGKSTLLKIISSITAPTKGQIKIRGKISSLLEVGTGFHPDLTGRENIYLNGSILGLKRNEINNKINDIITFAGVETYIDTPVKRYSSGMIVRLGFAIGAFLDNNILIIDEVLSVGDFEFQKKCLEKIDSLVKTGDRTIAVVSHNFQTINQICRRGILLKDGEKIFDGDVLSTVGHYYSELKKNSSKQLSQRTDRSGNGDVIFKDLFLTDAQGYVKDVFVCREKLFFKFVIEKRIEKKIDNLLAAFSVNSMLHGQLSVIQHEIKDFNSQFVELTCELKGQFVPGDYTMNLFISTDGVINDWIIEGNTFSIVNPREQNDLMFHAEQGVFLLDYSWR